MIGRDRKDRRRRRLQNSSRRRRSRKQKKKESYEDSKRKYRRCMEDNEEGVVGLKDQRHTPRCATYLHIC